MEVGFVIKVNGKEENAAGKTVAEVIESSGYNKARIAVELNMEIIPKARYGETILKDGDTMEVVSFVGGG